jgi:tetratricopeptide (TPR) repeat protein
MIKMPETPEFEEGDVVCQKIESKYHILRILKIEKINDDVTYHAMAYQPMDKKPGKTDMTKLEIFAMHLPLGSVEGEIIGNIPVTKEDLEGYYIFLQHTNFKRYLEETGQNADEVVKKAKEHYAIAWKLHDAKKYDEAIKEYVKAIDIMPFFYEAIDNMAFVKMDMEKYEEALNDFNWSMQINPKNFSAHFSAAECCYRLERYEEAKTRFEKAMEFAGVEDEKELTREWIEKANARINKK